MSADDRLDQDDDALDLDDECNSLAADVLMLNGELKKAHAERDYWRHMANRAFEMLGVDRGLARLESFANHPANGSPS